MEQTPALDAKHPGIFVRLPISTEDQRSPLVSLPIRPGAGADESLEVRSREEWPIANATKRVLLISKRSIPEAVGRRGTKGTRNPHNAALAIARQKYWEQRTLKEAQRLEIAEGPKGLSVWEVKVRLSKAQEQTEPKGEERKSSQ